MQVCVRDGEVCVCMCVWKYGNGREHLDDFSVNEWANWGPPNNSYKIVENLKNYEKI